MFGNQSTNCAVSLTVRPFGRTNGSRWKSVARKPEGSSLLVSYAGASRDFR